MWRLASLFLLQRQKGSISGDERDFNNIETRLVTMDETWLHHYDPETKQQSMEWRHSGSPRPQKFRVQKSTRKVLASIFLDQDGILRTDYLPTRSNAHLCWCNWRTFWTKNAAGSLPITKGVLFLHGNAPVHRGIVVPTWASNVLITHPILRIWPRRTTTCSLDWKSIERWPFFVRRGDLVGRTTFWFIFYFFWEACKSYSNGLRSILGFVGSMLWTNRKFGRCSLFSSWSG